MPGGASEIFVKAGGAQAQVFTAGRGDPLVYLHGGLGFQLWPTFLDQIAGEFTVYAPVMPGVGKSEVIHGIDDVLDLALYHHDLMDALGLEAPHVVGHFLGAMTAAETSAICPHRVDRLVLSSPAGMWLDDDPGVDFFATPASGQRSALFSDPDSAAARGLIPDPDSTDEREEENIQRVRAATAAAKFLWPIPDKGLKKRLHRIKAPTLVIVAEHDQIVPPVYGDQITGRIEGSTMRLIQGAGHLSMLEKPGEFADVVMGFLKGEV
jgi:pimeloyl-ACP methyl ester carboxylesterase